MMSDVPRLTNYVSIEIGAIPTSLKDLWKVGMAISEPVKKLVFNLL
jgi:hypothetical protein